MNIKSILYFHDGAYIIVLNKHTGNLTRSKIPALSVLTAKTFMRQKIVNMRNIIVIDLKLFIFLLLQCFTFILIRLDAKSFKVRMLKYSHYFLFTIDSSYHINIRVTRLQILPMKSKFRYAKYFVSIKSIRYSIVGT